MHNDYELPANRLIDEFLVFCVFLGIDFKQKLINLDGVPIKLQIWDVSKKFDWKFYDENLI